MKRRGFLGMLGAAAAALAIDPMFGGSAWGMGQPEVVRLRGLTREAVSLDEAAFFRMRYAGTSVDLESELMASMVEKVSQDIDQQLMEHFTSIANESMLAKASVRSAERIEQLVGVPIDFCGPPRRS